MRNLKNLQFSKNAIYIMFRQAMLICNSDRKKSAADNHKPKLFPLWTIATPSLLEDIKHKKFQSRMSQTFLPVDYIPVQPISLLEQQWDLNYLTDYLHKIRESIASYTSFGSMSPVGYNFELLLMCSNSYSLSTSPLYATGGSYAGPLNKIEFLPCINFTDREIQFFQQILKGTHDTIILKNLQIAHESEEVLKSLRLVVCNQLATELILSKLILYINNYALAQVLNIHEVADLRFSFEELQLLLEKCTEMYQVKNQNFLNDNQKSHFLKDYASYLRPKSYEEDYILVEIPEVYPEEEAVIPYPFGQIHLSVK